MDKMEGQWSLTMSNSSLIGSTHNGLSVYKNDNETIRTFEMKLN